jgi:hypothetical protein
MPKEVKLPKGAAKQVMESWNDNFDPFKQSGTKKPAAPAKKPAAPAKKK